MAIAPWRTETTVGTDPFRAGLAAARRGDFAAAARIWEALAVNGDARAQYNLGYLHANGQGVPRDYARALQWYTRAASQGFAAAQFNLGVLLS
ncbi:MAG: sel1 repeat family protein, partial [Gammaproteobacteria bacterium]|nr:sel1 repeat family protein [Gammaproteobacteria bacterium]